MVVLLRGGGEVSGFNYYCSVQTTDRKNLKFSYNIPLITKTPTKKEFFFLIQPSRE